MADDSPLRIKGPPGMRARLELYTKSTGTFTDVSEAARVFIMRGLDEAAERYHDLHKKPPPWAEDFAQKP